MSDYRPLIEPTEENNRQNEVWRTLTKKINDALSYLYGLVLKGRNGRNSITVDEETDLFELVNDVPDTDLIAQNKNMVYGWDKGTNERKWRADLGGYIGTKQVDETSVGNNKILAYNSFSDKVVYIEQIVGGSGHIHYYESHSIAATDESNKYIDLTVASYTVGNNSLQLWIKRTDEPMIPLTLTEDYSETSSVRIAFSSGIIADGDMIVARWTNAGTNNHTHCYEEHTVASDDVTAGYIDITTAQYTVGNNTMRVWLRRTDEPMIELSITDDFTETSSSRITFTDGLLTAGDKLIMRWTV